MPSPSLAVDWSEFDSQVTRLTSLANSLASLSPLHQKLAAEIIMVRLFFLAENSLQSVCTKLLCGAAYLDGRDPQRLANARSMSHALVLMQTQGRTKARGLSWGQSAEIRENLRFTLHPNDPALAAVVAHGTLLTDMRFVRNHIAHHNAGTRKNFHKLVRKHFGGLKPGLTIGAFLLRTSVGGIPLLRHYLASSRVFLKGLVRT